MKLKVAIHCRDNKKSCFWEVEGFCHCNCQKCSIQPFPFLGSGDITPPTSDKQIDDKSIKELKSIVNESKQDYWVAEFEELLDCYRRGYEGVNTAINKLRKEPNNVLEREIKAYISELVTQTRLSTIEEAKGCVPEERKVPQQQGKWMPMDDKNDGFNSARSQMFENLNKMK